LRLAVVSPFVDRRHGTERALAELLERLARDQHYEIHLYSQRVEGLALYNPSCLGSQGSSSRLHWHKVPSFPGPHLLQFIAWIFLNSIYRACDRHIRGLHFDLVLSPGINCLDADVVIVHALFCRLKELKLAGHPSSGSPGFLRRIHRHVYYSLLAGLERFIYTNPRVSLAAVSQRTATLLHDSVHRQDVHIIPNGVDTAQFSPSLCAALRVQARRVRQFQTADFVLLLIGNDWRVKGLDTILRAVGSLRDLPLRVLAAGDDSPDSFRELAKSLGIADRCSFEMPRPDVLDFYSAADLYVSPSIEDSFGLPVAEAMACGLPVIASANAGVAGQIHDGIDGFIVSQPEDAETLAQILRQLYSDDGLRRSIGDAAAKTAQAWTWDRNASQVLALLMDAAARKRQRPEGP